MEKMFIFFILGFLLGAVISALCIVTLIPKRETKEPEVIKPVFTVSNKKPPDKAESREAIFEHNLSVYDGTPRNQKELPNERRKV